MINRDEAVARIRRLPQFPYINKDSMTEWLDAVEAREPDRMEWHIRRLGGLGGTDLGEIVTHVRGGFGFRSLDTVVAEKMMAIPPAASNEKMRRGVELESTVRRMFHEQTGAIVRDDLINACMRDVEGEFGFIRSNPDDVVEIPGCGIYLPDYKCPDEPHSEISINYQTQLQVYDYKLLSALMGRFPDVSELPEIRGDRPALSVDAIVLVSLDYKNWRASPLQIEYDIGITSDALVSGKKVWDAICNGKQPKLSRAMPERFALSDEKKRQLESAEAKWAALKTIADQSSKLLKGARADMEKIIGGDGSADGMNATAHAGEYAKVAVQSKLNTSMLDEIRALNPQVDWESAMAWSGTYDADRLIQWAIENVDDFDLRRFERREPDADKVMALCLENGIRLPTDTSYTARMNSGKKAAAFNECVVPFVGDSVGNLCQMTLNVMAGRDALHGMNDGPAEPPSAPSAPSERMTNPAPQQAAASATATATPADDISINEFFGPR